MSKRGRDADAEEEPAAVKRVRGQVKALKEEWELPLLPEVWEGVFNFLRPADRESLAGAHSQMKELSRKKRRATTPQQLEAYYKRVLDLEFRDPQTGERTAFHKYVTLLNELFANFDNDAFFRDIPKDTVQRFRRDYFYQCLYAFGLMLQVRQNVDVVAALVPYGIFRDALKAPSYHHPRNTLRPIAVRDTWDRYTLPEILANLEILAPRYPQDIWASYHEVPSYGLYVNGQDVGRMEHGAADVAELFSTGVLTPSSLGLCANDRRTATIEAIYVRQGGIARDTPPAWVCALPVLRHCYSDAGHRYDLVRLGYCVAELDRGRAWHEVADDTELLYEVDGDPDDVLSQLEDRATQRELGVDAVVVQWPDGPEAADLLATVVSRPRKVAHRNTGIVSHFIKCHYSSADDRIGFALEYGYSPDVGNWTDADYALEYSMALTMMHLPALGYQPFDMPLPSVPSADVGDLFQDLATPFYDDRAMARLDAMELFVDRRDAEVSWEKHAANTLPLLQSIGAIDRASLARDPRAKLRLWDSIKDMIRLSTESAPGESLALVHYTCVACAAPAQHIRADGSEAFCARCVPSS